MSAGFCRNMCNVQILIDRSLYKYQVSTNTHRSAVSLQQSNQNKARLCCIHRCIHCDKTRIKNIFHFAGRVSGLRSYVVHVNRDVNGWLTNKSLFNVKDSSSLTGCAHLSLSRLLILIDGCILRNFMTQWFFFFLSFQLCETVWRGNWNVLSFASSSVKPVRFVRATAPSEGRLQKGFAAIESMHKRERASVYVLLMEWALQTQTSNVALGNL